MARKSSERPLISALSTLSMLGLGALAIVGGLFIAADALERRAEEPRPATASAASTAASGGKVGSTFAVRESAPPPAARPRQPDPAPAPAPTPAALPMPRSGEAAALVPAMSPAAVPSATATAGPGRVSTRFDGAAPEPAASSPLALPSAVPAPPAQATGAPLALPSATTPTPARAAPAPQPVAVAVPSIIADPAPAAGASAEPRPAGDRSRRGAAGCTGFKTYNPQTQTYRAFDGTIRDCKP